MTVWHIRGRSFLTPPPADWRSQLATRLGQRPRRVGRWAELALFGALRCLDSAGETTLPEETVLSVATLRGPDEALHSAVSEARDNLPLPIGFLQSQPSQLLPVLAQHLGWNGDGRCLATRDPLAALHLATAEMAFPEEHLPACELLLGWVDEAAGGSSCWLRLSSIVAAGRTLQPGSFADLASPEISVLRSEGPGRLSVA